MKKTTLLLLLLYLTSCSAATEIERSSIKLTSQAVPAVVSHPSLNNDKIITQAILTLINQTEIQLTHNLFTDSSTIILTHPSIISVQGELIMGRTEERPLQIELLIENNVCFIRENGQQQSIQLTELSCQPLPQ